MNRNNKYGMMFFPPDTGGNTSGAAGSGQQPPAQQPAQQGTPPQQQGAPPSNGFQSPFAGMDLELMDDQTRQAIQTAERQMQEMHGRDAQSRTFQSAADALQAQNEHLLQQLQERQPQGQQPQHQQDPDEIMRGQIEQILLDSNVPPAVAKQSAAMQLKMFKTVMQPAMRNDIGQRVAPFIQQQMDMTATDVFQSLKQSDPLGMLEDPEISQTVWDQIQTMHQQGQPVSEAIARNLAKIQYMNRLEANGGQALQRLQAQPQQQYQPHPPSVRPLGNVQSRFTFPGAGNYVPPPSSSGESNRGGTLPADADTQAAVLATIGHWPVVPKNLKGQTPQGGVKITRGYQS